MVRTRARRRPDNTQTNMKSSNVLCAASILEGGGVEGGFVNSERQSVILTFSLVMDSKIPTERKVQQTHTFKLEPVIRMRNR